MGNLPANQIDLLTVGELARDVSVRSGQRIEAWQVLAAVARGFLSPPRRVGRLRVWPIAEVDGIVQALQAAGYLRAAAPRPRMAPPGMNIMA